MFVRTRLMKSGRTHIQIVESIRVKNKIVQQSIRSLGTAKTQEEIDDVVKLAESYMVTIKNNRKPVLPNINAKEFYNLKDRKKPIDDTVKLNNVKHESTINDGINEVFGKVFKQLNLSNLFGTTPKARDWSSILESNVFGRLANPGSKRSTASMLKTVFGITTPLDRVYRMIDLLADKEEEVKQRICQHTLSLFKEQVDVLFFDVTTLAFESNKTDDLRDFGFSKDCKFNESQVVLALVTTTGGQPITYKLFPGNTYEGHTLLKMVKELKTEYHIRNILLVADRAMLSEENLSLMEEENINYIVASRLKSLPKKTKQQILSDQFYTATVINNDFLWWKEYKHNNRRLIVSYSGKRAHKDAADRQRLIDRLLKKTKDGKLKIADLISNHGTKKFITISSDQKAELNESKISSDAAWDGLHGVITNVPDKGAQEILSRYRELWQIEEAFRLNKHSLKMRPIYHWTPKRIKGHILICFIAYAVAKYTLYLLKKENYQISFEQLRDELMKVESIIVKDKKTQHRYVIPSKMNAQQEKIYEIFDIYRTLDPYAV